MNRNSDNETVPTNNLVYYPASRREHYNVSSGQPGKVKLAWVVKH